MPVRFLIADDVPAHRQLLANLVMMLGGESRLAADGREALRLAELEAFDVVLLDLGMPEMGGVATANRLIVSWKNMTHRPRIVAVTGHTSEPCRALCRAVGMDGFITKPFSVRTLNRSLKNVIMQGHCWEQGPAERILDVAWLDDGLAPEVGQPSFDQRTLVARTQLRELAERLEVLAPDECVQRAEGLRAFARQHGLLKLAPLMECFAKSSADGEACLFASEIAGQLAEFELAITAAHEWRSHAPSRTVEAQAA
ncbi:MAG: response regulator [Roseimicrobium sp.]